MEKKLIAIYDLETDQIYIIDDKFRFKCIEDCGKCCIYNEIPLREKDIQKISSLGYEEEYFVDYTKMFYRGVKFLGYGMKKRPFDDACVFLDPETKKCNIYQHRPAACRMYPFVLVKHKTELEIHAKEDSQCPGINAPDGEDVREIIKKYFMPIIEELKGEIDENRRPGQENFISSNRRLETVV
ncbi:YkgJ family cysteine cluster protein [Pyrococcus sp.]|uniref:YkgJ family cysteine cluster protein n=1 Tax=Pyrococcus sp. TaxID=33866 RepID=UPI002584858F|nr:YkgJ family cysteine cluster protein [Pyrococcus sp.]